MVKDKGFSLVELMIALVVLGIILAMAVPAMSSYLDHRKVIGAAEAVYGQLQYARSESISRSQDVFVRFSADNSTTWALGISTYSSCDITNSVAGVSSDCILVVDDGDGLVDTGGIFDSVTSTYSAFGTVDTGDLVYHGLSSTDFPGITLGGATVGSNVNFFSTGDQVRFNFTRGTATNGTIYLALPGKYEMRVLVSPVGRIKVCTPNTNRKVPGYSVCP
jgi:prepilin-type N-terminal cleavage/methylation domain-containing protein